MALKNLYLNLYQKFLENRSAHKGYDFQHPPSGSAPTPPVTFREKLKWWTLNRPSRLRTIVQERDRRQQEILAFKHPSQS